MMQNRKVASDGFMPWLVPGVAVSVVIHLAIAFYYLYQPKREVVQLPAAIPISVAMVAPIAAPKVEEQALNDGPQQVESIDAVATLIDDAPAEEREIEPEQEEVELASEPPPIFVKESKLNSELAKSQNVEPSESTSVRQVPAKVKQVPPAKPTVSKPASVAKVEQSAPKIEVENRQEKLQGVAGAFSQHLRQVRLDWKQQLVLHLERHKQYPRRAKRLRKQGVPLITFTMDRAGKVLGVELIRSSGTESLDREALDLVFRAMPLPSPPKEVDGETLTWTVPVRFYVQ